MSAARSRVKPRSAPKPKTPRTRSGTKGETTRQRVVDAARSLFRRRGLDATTMRDIAEAAGLSLGAAYYYFPSKEAIILAFYERQQVEHELRARRIFAETTDVRERIAGLFHAKLELVARERRLLGALFRSVGEPDDPLSVFARGSADLRRAAVLMFGDALAPLPLLDDLRALLAEGLWLLQLGFLLFFIHDESPGQARSHRLIDGTLDLILPLLPLLLLPGSEPLRRKLVALLEDSGLLIR